jgi:hypothetical protein
MYIISAIGMERLWIIRHCDKTNVLNNPCCSNLGYDRSKNWINYFKKYISLNNNIKIYTSKYNLKNNKNICDSDTNFYNDDEIINKNCQKSQRMTITSNIIYDSFINNSYSQVFIEPKFCIGQIEKIYDSINYDMKNYNKNKITDGILIWEHQETWDHQVHCLNLPR